MAEDHTAVATIKCAACKGTGKWFDHADGRCDDCCGKGYMTLADLKRVSGELCEEIQNANT